MSVYAVSDLHGMIDLYDQIAAFLKPEDKVYCLGDCGDRGTAPWETIKAVARNPQFTYLKGNHEDMLIGAMLEHLDDSRVGKFYQKYKQGSMLVLLYHNGGIYTLQGWINDGAKVDWANYLLTLPTREVYKNKAGQTIILTHAGYSPMEDDAIPNEDDLMWDREHFNIPWPKGMDDTIFVHGHTPCIYLNSSWLPTNGVICYADGHKYDIDMGSFASDTTCLLDLDTFDEHIFYGEKAQALYL